MRELPALGKDQAWACGSGCGECQPKASLFEYSRTEYPNGNVDSKSERIFVSQCCDSTLMLWDEGKQDFEDWEYVDDAAPPQEKA